MHAKGPEMWSDPRVTVRPTTGAGLALDHAWRTRRSLLENHFRRRRAVRIKRCDPSRAAYMARVEGDRARDDRIGHRDKPCRLCLADRRRSRRCGSHDSPTMTARSCSSSTSLRRDLPAERARLLVEQVELRRRAAEKFGDRAAADVLHPRALEQATDLWIARYKADAARRGRRSGDWRLLLRHRRRPARAGRARPATGWDVRRSRAFWRTQICERPPPCSCGDVTNCSRPSAGEAGTSTPTAARPAGARRPSADYSPGPELIDRWLSPIARGAVKLAPAAEAPAAWADRRRARMDHARPRVPAASRVVRSAGNGRGRRRATVVRRDGRVATLVGDPDVPCEPTDEPGALSLRSRSRRVGRRFVGSLAGRARTGRRWAPAELI